MNRRHAVNAALAVSLLVNAAAAGFVAVRVARKGGIRYLLERLDFADAAPKRQVFQHATESRFRKLPTTEGEIDFVGDSLIGNGPWSEFLSPIKNRGIGGDTTAGLLSRLDEVTESRPRKAFLLIGTNDLATDIPVAQLVRNYRKVLERFKAESPATEVYAISILPVNQDPPSKVKIPVHDNATIRETNRQLEALVAEFPGVQFLDVFDAFLDDSGSLREDFSDDGLHLNLDGYAVLIARLASRVHDGRATKW